MDEKAPYIYFGLLLICALITAPCAYFNDFTIFNLLGGGYFQALITYFITITGGLGFIIIPLGLLYGLFVFVEDKVTKTKE